MLPCGTPLGKVQTPHKITGGGQEQSPTLAMPPRCSKLSRWQQSPRVTRKTTAINPPSTSRCKSMIDALESLNLTQESQSNAKEMSWDERGCFGSAQCAHKYVKCPREGDKSRPTHIYIDAPLRKESLSSLHDRRTRLSLTRQTRRPVSVTPPCATCPRASNFNGRAPHMSDTFIVFHLSVCRPNRRNTESSILRN
jgi:hypothetical protein